jgi:hypothetical protein
VVILSTSYAWYRTCDQKSFTGYSDFLRNTETIANEFEKRDYVRFQLVSVLPLPGTDSKWVGALPPGADMQIVSKSSSML